MGFLGPAGGLRLLLANIFDSDEEEEQDFKEKLNQWRTGNAVAGKKKSVNYVYKSVDDVIAESQFRKIDKDSGDKSKGEGVKVIDMTGREQRVLTGTNQYFDERF